ncbi:hypothetical protein D0Y65_021035 [Glycine soja]|uniref:Uncharacterized protein n=1 Tax=Glycine soja TaxID=3848 RepID=A0A445JH81_GLYSO|nr:hypothetical protein D0Y65_021035 [Glycine soja]RZB97767.1 hypothetical protein D0Y65_021035 [Glycine soja]RZB97768.1 hypothetical protein D0Y65_021035 [Glycine soja]
MLLGKCGPRKQQFFNNTSEFHASVQHFDVVSRECRSSHQHHKSYQPCFSSSAATIGAQSSAWSQPQSSHPSFEVPIKMLQFFKLSWLNKPRKNRQMLKGNL